MKNRPKFGIKLSQNVKMDLKMKLSLLLLLTTGFVLQANSSYSQDTKVSLDLTNVTISEVFDEIESQTEFKFIFNTRAVNLERKVSLKFKRKRISVILKHLFSAVNTEYIIDNRKILLRRARDADDEGKTHDLTETQSMVNGKIIDNTGSPLPGASIVEKDTANGAISDFEGNFELAVTNGAVLVISYVGFKTIEVDITGKDTIEVTLEEDAAKLDEVVVTALGISRDKKSLGYSVENVDGSEVSEVKNANFINSLSGKVAGVNIKASGSMGGSTNVIIRGYSSLTGDNQALFVVDGTPINNSNNNSAD